MLGSAKVIITIIIIKFIIIIMVIKITEKCVYCAVRTYTLNKIHSNFIFERSIL